jgi:DNA (cytosine-5)-methyltransferase 1
VSAAVVNLADVCCNAGQGADGYSALGIAPHGWDLFPQPHYPYPFTQGDGIALLQTDEPETFDALHTSWPCQAFTTAGHLRDAQGGEARFLDLLTPGMALLRERWNHKPWIVENVDDNQGKVRAIMAPREGEYLTVLCGSMFHLQVQRHRLFLTNFPVPPFPQTAPGRGKYVRQGCRHDRWPVPEGSTTGRPRPWGVWHVAGDQVPSGGRTALNAEHGREVMGGRRALPWEQLKEGFPPAYTTYIGHHLLRHLGR